MKRYDNTGIRFNKIKGRVYRTTFYPVIEEHPNDIYIISRIGDSFSQLAYRYYQDQNLWWVIAKANNIATGSMMIEPGTRIRIPSQLSQILADFEKENR